MPDRFDFSDESVNAYGFRVLTSGIDFEHFKKNPIMLYEHERFQSDKNYRPSLPIGRWEEVSVKDGVLSGAPVFDEDDELGKQVKQKVEKKMLNAVSIGFDVIELSDDPKHLVPGQTRPTVVKCRLKEVSFVKFPANRNAVRLYKNGQLVELSEDGKELDMIIPLLSDQKPLDQQKQDLNMKEIAIQLGLAESATTEEIVKAIQKLSEERSELLFELAEQKGVLSDHNKAHYQKLAAADFKTTKELLLSAKPTEQKAESKKDEEPQSITDVIKEALSGGNSNSKKSKEDWTFNDWEEKDPAGLRGLKLNSPEKYTELAKTYKSRKK